MPVDAARQKPRRHKEGPRTLPPSHHPCSHPAPPGAAPGFRARASLPPPYGGAEGDTMPWYPFFLSVPTALLRRKSWPHCSVEVKRLRMPLVSASLWGRLNPRKDRHASPDPGLKPRCPSASATLAPGTASHSVHKPNGILVFPRGCCLPSMREQA